MLDVVIALIPAAICSFVFYGWREMLLMAVSVASCVLLEWAITRFMLKKPSTIGDFSAVITGMLLALNLPYSRRRIARRVKSLSLDTIQKPSTLCEYSISIASIIIAESVAFFPVV